jgi:FMN phosphatase YigB (HAD superfamily)
MIRIVFFDVGETLIHDGQPFTAVKDALSAISQFKTADGAPLLLGVISDFTMPTPPPTEEKILGLERQYRDQVLNPNCLAVFFQPFESRVTLSSRAGMFKPEHKIFEAAVARSGTGAALPECMFVTENTEHLKKCKEFGITPVQFGPGTPGMAAFDEWVDAPAVIAGLVAPDSAGNQTAAIAPALSLRFGLVNFTSSNEIGETVQGRASQLMQLNDPRLGPLNGVFVERPAEVTAKLGSDGRVTGVTVDPADPEEVPDAVNFVSTLVKSGQLEVPGQLARGIGVSHVVERDSAGRLRLHRRGFGRT